MAANDKPLHHNTKVWMVMMLSMDGGGILAAVVLHFCRGRRHGRRHVAMRDGPTDGRDRPYTIYFVNTYDRDAKLVYG